MSSHRKRHIDRFSCFRRAHVHTNRHTETDHMYSNRPHLKRMLCTVMQPKIAVYYVHGQICITIWCESVYGELLKCFVAIRTRWFGIRIQGGRKHSQLLLPSIFYLFQKTCLSVSLCSLPTAVYSTPNLFHHRPTIQLMSAGQCYFCKQNGLLTMNCQKLCHSTICLRLLGVEASLHSRATATQDSRRPQLKLMSGITGWWWRVSQDNH